MPFEKIGDNGGIVITGKDDIALTRLMVLRSGLSLEVKGIQVRRGRSCYAIVKQEFGLKGNKAKVLAQFEVILEAKKVQRLENMK